MDFLRFTSETEDDFESKWLPTLDLELKIVGGFIMHRFYEKPTTASTTVQARSAMEDTSKKKILGNDLTRRLLNTMEGLGSDEIKRVIDGYSCKLLNSGFSRERVVEILISGIRAYERKARRCRSRGTRLYRTF